MAYRPATTQPVLPPPQTIMSNSSGRLPLMMVNVFAELVCRVVDGWSGLGVGWRLTCWDIYTLPLEAMLQLAYRYESDRWTSQTPVHSR